MKLFGFRINAGEIKDVREIEKTLENIEEKKNKIIQQVIKPALKEAGFHSLRGTQAFSIHKEASTIAVNIQSS